MWARAVPLAPGSGEENYPGCSAAQPGEAALWRGPGDGNYPVVPLPNPGEGGPVAPQPWPNRPTQPSRPQSYAAVRFLNAAYGYAPFRIFVQNTRMVRLLNYAAASSYLRIPAGYQTVTVTGANGYIYLQKTLPFPQNARSTVAIVNTAGGLDLLQIPDTCCAPARGYGGFRVSNLARNSTPLDVLLADGRVVYADVRFKETTSFKQIRPGSYQFYFAETSLMPMPDYQDIETLDAGLYRHESRHPDRRHTLSAGAPVCPVYCISPLQRKRHKRRPDAGIGRLTKFYRPTPP